MTHILYVSYTSNYIRNKESGVEHRGEKFGRKIRAQKVKKGWSIGKKGRLIEHFSCDIMEESEEIAS